MAKKTKEFEEKIEKALDEGFDLGVLLDNVNLAETKVSIFLDSAAAYKAVEINAKIKDLVDSAEQVHSITETPAEQEIADLVALREKMEASAVTFTLRSLSNSELNVIKKTVAHSHPIPKKANEDERAEAQNERGEVVNEHLLAVSCTAVETADGRRNPGVTVTEAHRLRESIPTTEWERLVNGILEAMTRAQVAEQVMAEPTFRWSDAESE